VTGVVIIQSRGELGHNGLTLTVDGHVNLQLSAKSVGMFEAFYNSLKVRFICQYLELACVCRTRDSFTVTYCKVLISSAAYFM